MILTSSHHPSIVMPSQEERSQPQRKQTKQKPACSTHANTTTTCGAYDVLCGKNSYSNPGNEFFRKLIQKHRDTYRATAVRDQKRRIIETVIDQVHRRGGRFLKSSTSATEIPHTAQYEKVSHALRSARAPVSTAVQTRADLAGNVSSLLEKQRQLFAQYCRQQAAADSSAETTDTEDSSLTNEDDDDDDNDSSSACVPQPIGSGPVKSLDAEALYALLNNLEQPVQA